MSDQVILHGRSIEFVNRVLAKYGQLVRAIHMVKEVQLKHDDGTPTSEELRDAYEGKP